MPVVFANVQTKLNRLKVALGASAITPASGLSIDAAGGSGQLVIGASNLTPNTSTGVLGTIPLQNPSCTYAPSGSTGVATLAGTPLSATASANGTAALAEMRDKNGVTQISGLTVGISGSGADIIILSTSVTVGQTITCTGGTLSE